MYYFIYLGVTNKLALLKFCHLDRFPVLATLKLKLKRSTQPQTKHFIPNLSSLSNIDVSREYAANVSSKLRAASLEYQTLEAMWGHYKSGLDLSTLAIIDQRRQAIRRGDVEEYRRLARPRRRSLRHDKQQWMEQVARTGENHLLCG